MGTYYKQLSLEERCQLSQLRGEGKTIRKIAAIMDRSPSTLAREVKRNTTPSKKYTPSYAHLSAKSKRWKGSKLERIPSLRKEVLCLLQQGLSPQQVSGRFKLLSATPSVSTETIYRFLYAQIQRTTDYSWRHYLPQSKHKRGRRRKKRSSPVLCIKHRVSIHDKPQSATKRDFPGHWEADLMLFSKYGQALLVAHERSSRLTLVFKQANKSASLVAQQLTSLFRQLPTCLRRSITFDNGTEFAHHYQLHPLGIKTYFCDIHAPWQKGGVENAIGRMRRVLPRKTDISLLSSSQLHLKVQAYNHTPRKCLGYRTPAEVFLNQVLHFECESTSPRTRG